MEKLNFENLKKKNKNISILVSEYEREQIDKFCREEQITISNFLRYAIREVINQDKKHE